MLKGLINIIIKMFLIFTTIILGTIAKYLNEYEPKVLLNNCINYTGMEWLKDWLPTSWRVCDNTDKTNDNDSESTNNIELPNDKQTETTMHKQLKIEISDFTDDEEMYVKIPKVPRLRKGYYRIRFENSDEPAIDYISTVNKDIYMNLVNHVKEEIGRNDNVNN